MTRELNFPNNPGNNITHRDDANSVLYENSNYWGTPVFTGPTMGADTGSTAYIARDPQGSKLTREQDGEYILAEGL